MPLGQIYYIWNVKRIASFLLLVLFLFNVVGYFVLYSVLDTDNRAAISRKTIEPQCLQTVRIHVNDMKNIVFRDHGKEFLYNGEIYDIKTRSTEGDFIVFRCINDKKEKQLLAGLQFHVKNYADSNTSSDKKQDNSSKSPIKTLFLHSNDWAEAMSVAVVYPPAIFQLTFYISPTLPLPPPEVSIA